MERVWILGAADPEMEMIESILRARGERVEYAMIDGRRVRGGEAYAASLTESSASVALAGGQIMLVECIELPMWAGHTAEVRERCVRIDHHHPGDPGYGRPAAEFWQASSLGQVIAILGHCDVCGGLGGATGCGGDSGYDGPCHGGPYVSEEHRLIAAADHCLGAAYRGQCPGVDPDALLRWRVESRAAFQGRSTEAILADIEAAHQALLDAPTLCLESVSEMEHTEDHNWMGVCDGCAHDEAFARDMRGRHVPELVEAGTRYGIAYIADGLPDPAGRVRIVCSGDALEVRAFLYTFAERNDLVDCYGDPARGFAGGYVAAR